MNELIAAARAAKEYLQQKDPMTGGAVALVSELQTGIEEAIRDVVRISEFLQNQNETNSLLRQIIGMKEIV